MKNAIVRLTAFGFFALLCSVSFAQGPPPPGPGIPPLPPPGPSLASITNITRTGNSFKIDGVVNQSAGASAPIYMRVDSPSGMQVFGIAPRNFPNTNTFSTTVTFHPMFTGTYDFYTWVPNNIGYDHATYNIP